MIKQINIKDFGKIDMLQIKLDAIITGLFGENGAGKSTIKDAIEFCLTGLCRGIKKKNEMACMIRNGEKQAVVSITLEDGKMLERVLNPSGQRFRVHEKGGYLEDEGLIKSIFGVSQETITLALSADTFMEKSPKERLKFLQDVFGIQVTPERIIEMLPEYGIPEKHFDKSYISMHLDNLGNIQKGAVTARRSAKQELEALKVAESVNPVVVIDGKEYDLSKWDSIKIRDAEKLREEKKKTKGEIEIEIARAEGVDEGRKSQIQKDISELETEISERPNYEKQLKNLGETKSQLEKQKTEKEVEVKAAMDEITKLNGEFPSIKSHERVPVECPIYKVPCNSRELIGSAIEKTIASKIKYDNDYTALSKKSNSLSSQVDKIELEIKEIESKISPVKNKLANIRIKEERLNTLNEELNELSIPQQNIENLKKALEDINKRIATADLILSTKANYTAWEKYRAESERINSQITINNAIDKAFAPDGIPARLIRPVMETLESLTATTSRMLDGFKINPDCTFIIDGTPENILSESEKWRLGLIVQDAICRALCVKFLIIDRMDVLVGSNRTSFLKTMKALSENYEEIIFMASNTRDKVKPSPWDIMRFLFLESGEISEIREQKEAA